MSQYAKSKFFLIIFNSIFIVSVNWCQQLSAALPVRALPSDLGTVYKFDILTPTGDKIFRSSLLWESIQIDYPQYPRPAKCAFNASRVLRMSGLPEYSAESVGQLLRTIVNAGGSFVKLPTDTQGIISKLNSLYNGNIPVGTVIGGCLYSDCFTGITGQRHSAIVGEVDKSGNIYVYHNNWYRPESENGVWKHNMVSKLYLNKGYLRQWMPTPWLKLIRNSDGVIIDVKSLMPQIDDLDPKQYFVSFAIPKEITGEIASGQGHSTAGSLFDFNNLDITSPKLLQDRMLQQNSSVQSDPFDVEFDDDGTSIK